MLRFCLRCPLLNFLLKRLGVNVHLSEPVKKRQAQIEKLYEGLKDLAEERRGKLDETLKLYQLQGEIDDLEHWIAQKEVVAGSQDIGQDLAQVEVKFILSFIHMLCLFPFFFKGSLRFDTIDTRF